MAIRVTRKQSLVIGLAILGAFFLTSTLIIWSRSHTRIPSSSTMLTVEGVRGEPTQSPSAQSTAQTNRQQDSQSTPQVDKPFVLNDFHRTFVKDGKTEWEVFGSKGDYNPIAGVADVVDPRLTVTRPNEETITLTAKKAHLIIRETELTSAELTSDVVVTYKGDTTLKTEHATYDREKHLVDVPTRVEVENPMVRVEAATMIADIESQVITLSGGVHSTIKPKVKEPPHE